MTKFKYAPGLPGYGTRGSDGTPGSAGLSTYFSAYNGLTDSITIKSKIIGNNILFPTVESLPGGRTYLTGDQFVDTNGRIFRIDFNESNLYVNTSQQLNTTGFFEIGPNTVSTPVYTRYSNSYSTDKFLIDVVYASTPPGNYTSNPSRIDGSIYGIGAVDFAQVKYVDNAIGSYHPYTVWTNSTNTTEPNQAIALVKEDEGNAWRLGNLDGGGNQRDVSLYLDFGTTYGTFKGNFEGSITSDNLYLPGWLRVDGDASLRSNVYVGNNLYVDNNISVGNSVSIDNDLTVSDDINVSGTLNANDLDLTGWIKTDGDASFGSDVDIGGALNVNGTATANKLTVGDGEYITAGDDDDFRIFHTGATNYIKSYYHGAPLYIQGLNDAGASIDLLTSDPDGPTNLHYAGGAKLQTTSTGIYVIGDVVATGDIDATDSDKLDGEHGAFYRNANNLNDGSISIDRMYGINDPNRYLEPGTHGNTSTWWDTISIYSQIIGGRMFIDGVVEPKTSTATGWVAIFNDNFFAAYANKEFVAISDTGTLDVTKISVSTGGVVAIYIPNTSGLPWDFQINFYLDPTNWTEY